MGRHALGLLCLLLALQLLTVISSAEQLPVKTYTTVEGLPRDAVTLIRRDSRGFIWVAAGDGISRFDGYKFTNYTTDDGLPDRRVNDLLETRNGVYWIATDGGLCRFNPDGLSRLGRKNPPAQHDENGLSIEPMFVVYNPTKKPIVFNALREDETGAIWCATSEGLYRLELSPNGSAQIDFVDLGDYSGESSRRNVAAILKDHHGALWCGVGDVLERLLPDGRIEHYSKKNGLPGPIVSLLEDRKGNIWAGTRSGLRGDLLQLVESPDPSRPIVARICVTKGGSATTWINSLFQARDGKLLAATPTGLYFISPSNNARAPDLQLYDSKNGLCSSISDVTEDRDGNLWVASACGAQRIARNGFTGFGPADGLDSTNINSIFENREGALFVINYSTSNNHSERIINKFDGTRFQSVKPNLPSKIWYSGWGWGQTIIQDHLGEWWIPGFGLRRFPKVERIEGLARVHPQFMRTLGGDYDHSEIFRLYEDSHGDLWMAITGGHYSLLRWKRTTGLVHDYTAEAAVPPKTDFTAFLEDRAGNLWIGTSDGAGLLRFRDGKFRRFTADDGAPAGWVISLYLDRVGRLWVASQLGGLTRIDDPTADSLHVTAYTTADGLSSNNIRSITEDEWGRIYVGTGHGVDRLDSATGSVKHFTVAEGLPKGDIAYSYCDRQGALWFGSAFGLSRLTPEKQESLILPSVYLTGLRIEGVERPVSKLGTTDLPTLDLAPDQRQVSVDFIGLGASLGEELRYQYYLEGVHDDWSPPTTDRTINFASLAPGTYRFRVRALVADGRMSSRPATFAFKIAAPVWQRGWFLALVSVVVGLGVYSLYRFRVGRLLELERIRTRIATDLHDDVGSGLSQVSILSEVISRRVGPEKDVAEQLSTIASLSRDMVDSMSDIVWAINPGRDRLSDLSQRMRRFASDVFSAQGSEFVFNAPHPGYDIKLGPEMRRELFLIFKEAVNNVVRHSGCTAVKISFLINDGALELLVLDNGKGFDHESDSEGNGLTNMRLRAQKLGGQLRINSNNGHGTVVILIAPLGSRRWFWLGLRRNANR
jgi:ligand-binding sensor domain-containing protein/two-component sensor histidine kinase